MARLNSWETYVAMLASVASIAASGTSIASELADGDRAATGDAPVEPAMTAPSCAKAIDEVLDLVEEHPAAGAVYARSGPWGTPALAAGDLIDTCGNPETLVEQTGVVKPTGKE